ncbi:MAG: hypothetical protein GF388_00390 [Candidatus Aegiribacteria sp.]|nr:hypothetical protein [Candidatus Aegiribacteria sp.]
MRLEHLNDIEYTIERTVQQSMTASALGSGGVDVLATPYMILLFEQAARDSVQEHLPEGYTTVGTQVNIKHLSATPVDEKVTVTARVSDTNGRRIYFQVEARDEHQLIGIGKHERFLVNLDKFMNRLEER